MLDVFIILTLILMLIAVAVFPKLGFYLTWLVLCLYPHGWWENLGVPLNIGFDDLFTVYWVIVVAARKGLCLSGAHKLMILFFLTVCLGNTTGYMLYGDRILGLGTVLVVEILKCSTFIMFAIAMNRLIETERDFQHAWLGLLVGLGAGAVLALYSYYDPGIMVYFGTKRSVTLAEWGTSLGGYRAAGAFTEPATAALSMMLGLAMTLLGWYQCSGWRRLLLIGCALVFVAVALLTGTRTILLALIMVIAAFPFLRGSRLVLVGLSVVGILVLLLDSTLLTTLYDRLNTLDSGRPDIWRAYLSKLDIQRLLLGEGQWPGILIDGGGFQGHNAFIDMLCYYGIWGLFAGVALYVFCIRNLLRLHKSSHPMGRRLYGSATAFLIFFFAFSMTGETMTPGSWGLRIFFILMIYLESGRQLFASSTEQVDPLLYQTAHAHPNRLAGGAE